MDLHELFVPRSVLEEYLTPIKRPRPVSRYGSSVLIGIRFIGKTTCLYRKAIQENIPVFSGDLARIYGVGPKELLRFLKNFRAVAVDEIHLIRGRQDLFKALRDRGVRVLATGSSMVSILSSPDFLRRIKPVRMHTLETWERFYLSTGKLVDLKRRTLEELYHKASTIPLDLMLALKEHGERKLLLYGGFPASLIVDDPLELRAGVRNSLERLIEKDLTGDPNAIATVLRCIAETPGNVYSCFVSHYGRKHRSFVRGILEKLIYAGLIFPVYVGDPGSKVRHRYFTDPAFYLVYGSKDIGLLLEATIGYALRSRGYTLIRPGGRSKTKPDFVAITPSGRRMEIEVKHGDEEPSGYDFVLYGKPEVKRKGGTTYVPRYLVMRAFEELKNHGHHSKP